MCELSYVSCAVVNAGERSDPAAFDREVPQDMGATPLNMEQSVHTGAVRVARRAIARSI